MAKMYGNFEVDLEEAWVRIKVSDTDEEYSYEYVVNSLMCGTKKNALHACKAFVKGYRVAKSETKHQFREMLL